MALKTLERAVAQVPEAERAQAATDISALGTTLLHDRSALRRAVELFVVDDDVPQEQAAQEARNLKRVFELWRKVAAESLDADSLGVDRRVLQQLRDKNKLLALKVPMRRGFIYPAWQFDPASGEPLATVPKLIDAAEKAHLKPLDLHLLMVSRAAEEGTAPAQWLASGDVGYVLGIVNAAGSQGG
jgi:hypothetical protein